jgi:hypothetical protein
MKISENTAEAVFLQWLWELRVKDAEHFAGEGL